jgi:hypothetical protein
MPSASGLPRRTIVSPNAPLSALTMARPAAVRSIDGASGLRAALAAWAPARTSVRFSSVAAE